MVFWISHEYLKLIFNDHKVGVEYKLTTEAQKEFDEISDSFAECLNDRYNEEHVDEEKENTIPSTYSPNLCMTTSKDILHVLRLVTILQVLTTYIKAALHNNLDEITVNCDISLQ